ncbi:hypothetical protein [Celeribacter sp. PS-C1]|uniref:hypothetical protein n=1 Tax=Celeribacter sp. PS-C1 TaxID=2820813 RepID=UPI001CA5DBD4|nr:hypothetical protein [Celeribacter sp. PS-C1]MBW6419516.1 hypothetical protein [Celeribacter sp. PS-C1]
MDVEVLQARLSRQTGDERQNMLIATRVSPKRLSDWLALPNAHPLEPEEVDELLGWVHGEFGMDSRTQGWIRIKRADVATVKMQRFAAPKIEAKTYTAGQGTTGAKVIKEASAPVGNQNVPEAERAKANRKPDVPAKNEKETQPLFGLGWRK